ncbi:phospholipid carrier-dependent glycosyltransferase [Luteitalea sp.]|jgi:4-amino-4-deoxy-L-arabinose transferase-like glycosyltransferase|uniref:phospholipid carrier-dependent glycosyltransferase n=1 Tax=Luteitalea sp. TaxID=2004800 RepID=UPI0037C68EAE
MAGLLLAALLHAWLHASVRPMFQVSDEISYLAGLQQRIYATERAGTDVYVCASPPEGIPLPVDAGGKPLFRWLGGLALRSLCASGIPSTTVYWGLRLACGLTFPWLVLLTFLLSREVLPDQPTAWVAAAAVVAFQPLAATVSGGITPDSFANLLGATSLLLTTRLMLARSTRWELALLPVSVVLALATKDTVAFLVPTLMVAVLLRGWQAAPQARSSRAVVALAAATVLAAGWAALRVLPPTTLAGGAPGIGRGALALLTGALAAASSQAWAVARSMWMPLGNFGASTLELPDSLIVVPVLFVGLVCLGLARSWLPPDDSRLHRIGPLWAAGLLLCALQPAIREVLVQLPDSYQGRWLFPMLPVMAVLATAGVGARVPRLLLLGLLLLATVAGLALVRVAGHYYLHFPGEVDASRLFLRSSSGVPLDMHRLALWVERPDLLRAPGPFLVAGLGWLAAIVMAMVGAARLALLPETLHERHADDR